MISYLNKSVSFYSLLALLIFITMAACNSSASGTKQADGVVIGEVNRKLSLRETKQENEDKLSGSLAVRMGEAKAKRGQTVCLPVEISNMNGLLGLQYTMRFDSAALKYTQVRNFGIPQYGPSNFGVRFAERGYVSTLWHDGSLKGVTVPTHTKAFEICFENLMPKGQSTEVKFQDGPTPFEVVRVGMQQMHFVYANGKVTSR